MPNQLDMTQDQRDGSDRHNLREVIYLLSGTMRGRGAVPSASFYWSTREVTALGKRFEPYLGPPRQVTRGMGFEPGAGTSTPPVDVPVRNLPFAHSESIVAALSDDDFSLENTEATLRVAYLRPGQDPNNLADADWTPLVLSGFLGPPKEVKLDGLVLPVFSKGSKRNSLMRWPRMPSRDSALYGVTDRKDVGRMVPIPVGRPDGWFKPLTWNVGVRGFTVSGYAAGSTEIQFRAMTVGNENLASGNAPATGAFGSASDPSETFNTSRAGLMIHYRTPVYEIDNGSAVYDDESQIFTVTLTSGLAGSVPRGAYVQQWGPGLRTSGSFTGNDQRAPSWDDYLWVLSPYRWGSNDASALQAGWLFQDGQIRPAELGTWAFKALGNNTLPKPSLYGASGMGGFIQSEVSSEALDWTLIALSRWTREDPAIPVYYDPGDPNTVKTQPEFTSTTLATSKLNYGTGGTGTDNDLVRDGNTDTGVTLGAGSFVTNTYNDAPSPFANDDTVTSVIHLVANGAINLENSTGSTTFLSVSGPAGVRREYRATLASPVDFNETVRIEGGVGGGVAYEVWWEHDLSAEVTNTRTQDVEIGGASVSGTVGEAMLYADLVVRFPPRIAGAFWGYVPSEDDSAVFGHWSEGEVLPEKFRFGVLSSTSIVYPTAAMGTLHHLLGNTLEAGPVNKASYDLAHQRFVDKNMRVNFVLTEEMTWNELETAMGEQTRSTWFYGPSGHEVVFMEDASGVEDQAVYQSFRLPGCPGANVLPGGQPLMERTSTTELVNTVEVLWAPNQLDGNLERRMVVENAASVADIGVVRDTRGPRKLTMHSPFPENPNYSGEEVVSGLAAYYAERQSFAATRFRFDSAWIAHGLDRGTVIRVSYPVSTTPASYRNVVCEVEEITASPISSERFTIQARSLTKPQKGLDPNLLWSDVYITDADNWSTRVLQDYDTWADYWSTP